MPQKRDNALACTKNWLAPVLNSASDYYHRGSSRHCGVPHNIFGRQQPHSGDAYAGICVRTGFLEYVQTKLTDTLTAGQDYLVEFYVSRAERSIGSAKEFGVKFNKKMTWALDEGGIQEQPNIDFPKPKGYKNKRKWTKLSAVYKAEGYEATLILGYFNYDKKKRYRGFCHYYIDDVSVTPIKSKADTLVSTKPEEVVTKPFEPVTGEAIALRNIFFVTNKSELLPESFPELNKLVSYLKENDNFIEISGHTDNTGNNDQNKLLSKARAKAVADYLIQNGIVKTRISYIGYGSFKPIASNDTDEGKQQNRRVEFTINKR